MLDRIGVPRWSQVVALAYVLVAGDVLAQVMIRGDVDRNGVVTCRDVALARDATGTRAGEPGFLPSADMDGNGQLERDDVRAIATLLPRGSTCAGTNYVIILGHDGSPDPDDNLAQLAGFMAVKRNSQRDPRFAFGGLVFGDTPSVVVDFPGIFTAGKPTMISGSDALSRANWDFHRAFIVPTLLELGLTRETHADVVTETWNFNATNPAELTSAGRLIFGYAKAAIDAGSGNRVVYTAGGGHHAPAEAIALLRNLGYSDAQILEHFAVVQHSAWNWHTFTEAGPARPLTLGFTIRIDDQNGTFTPGPTFRPRSGYGFPPTTVSPACTSQAYADAWFAAAVGGAAVSGIPNHRATNDASDSGEADFATRYDLIERHWYTRGVGLNLSVSPNLSSRCDNLENQAECIVHDRYSTAEMNANLNCAAEFNGFFPPIANLPAKNHARAGHSVPVRFAASDFDGANVLNILSVSSQRVSCATGEPSAARELAVGTRDSGLWYDAATNTYAFDWKTSQRWSGTCRRLQIQRDGALLAANFEFSGFPPFGSCSVRESPIQGNTLRWCSLTLGALLVARRRARRTNQGSPLESS